MSQRAMIEIGKEDERFIEIACRRKLLTEKTASICRHRMQMGFPASTTAMVEGFLSAEAIAEIYKEIENEKGDGDDANVYLAQADVEETWEQKLIAAVRDKELLSSEAWNFCYREQKRLAKQGYSVPLSAIIHGSGCMESKQLLSIYQDLAGDTAVAVVERELPFADVAVPAMRTWAGYVKKQLAKTRAERDKDAVMLEQLQQAMETIHAREAKKAQAKRRKTAAKVEEEASTMEKEQKISIAETPVDEDSAVSVPVEEKNAAAPTLPVGSAATVVMSDDIVHQIKQCIDSAIGELRRELVAKEDSDEDLDPREVQILKRGKRTVMQEDLSKKLLKTGGKLENAYIPRLHLSGVTIGKKVEFCNCLIEDLNMENAKIEASIDFQDCVFLGKAVLRGATFAKDALFRSARFIDGGDFTKVQFAGNTHFNSAAFLRFASFNHTHFAQKCIFSRSYFAKGVKFAEVIFERGASFNDAGCDHRFYMDKCTFNEESTFSGMRFADIADFARCKFRKTVKFKGTYFNKWVSFNSATFKDECHFNGANASGDMSFKWTKFEGLINLRTLCGERNVDFNNAKIGVDATFCFLDAYLGRLFLTREQLEGHVESELRQEYVTAQKEYGLLKNNFREINEYDREDWAYQMEKRMGRKSYKIKGPRSALSRFFNWVALDLACGYGTKPLNIFLTSFVILLLFAAFFCQFGNNFEPGINRQIELPFLDAVQVSFRTFTNAEVGGRELREDSWLNYVMMLESFLGVFVITVLVVTFSRKVIR